MSQQDSAGSMSSYDTGEGRERGARRRKVYGYLKAANDLRQSYQAQWSQKNLGVGEDEEGIPGAFPDVEIVRSGKEEMVLFPSYARPHTRRHHTRETSNSQDIVSRSEDNDNTEPWRNRWESLKDDKAIVDVDVRGWIYSPHSGPMTRRNRLIVAVARKLSGIPAPSTTSPAGSRSSSRHASYRGPMEDRSSKHEEEAAAMEAQSLVRRGEGEADAAWRGGYSQNINFDSPARSPHSSRPSTPDTGRAPLPSKNTYSDVDSSLLSERAEDNLSTTSTRNSWNQPADMTRAELAAANAHMMARLKPFMSLPLVNTPITVFFFNDQNSQSRTINTNESGHFSIRAPLEFVPHSVRVLASENLSAVEEVRITEAQGVSLISDIDDTIKHSAIANGAKEIFRNTFVRDLGDLTVQGVREWYTRLSQLGVKLHYVSNSPWQLYPLLQSYFHMAGLPKGSFHLKQYSGMLQGIFEPAAERKKGSLEKIMRDFPERKFILVGDSGEADLEVYTDIVLANPGKILGIFIRDVTTPENRRFFDTSTQHIDPFKANTSRTASSPQRFSRTQDLETQEARPPLPPRRQQMSYSAENPDLIDFDDDSSTSAPLSKSTSNTDLLRRELGNDVKSAQPPARPTKPLALRSTSTESRQVNKPQAFSGAGSAPRKQEPPPPPKPRRTGTSNTQPTNTHIEGRPVLSRAKQLSSMDNSSSKESEGYAAAARHRVVDAYNNLPSARSLVNDNGGGERDSRPIPPRPSTLSYPAAAAQFASNRLSWSSANDAQEASGGSAPSYNRKEEIWRRRWARAEDDLRHLGVVLKSWRVGTDVMSDTVHLVEKALRDMGRDMGRDPDRISGNH
ncbi:MAG: hypothetical protein Q9160_003048 [Pyrenula sp. 1 TL-2023]